MFRLCGPLLVVAALIVGCGSNDGDATPEGSPRAVVVRFLDDLGAGRGEQACAVLAPELQADLRERALAGFHPTGTTLEQRMRSVQHTQAATRRCPVAADMLGRQLGKRLARLRASVVRARMTKPFPVEARVLDDQAWIVEARDGRWMITVMNGLADAAAQAR